MSFKISTYLAFVKTRYCSDKLDYAACVSCSVSFLLGKSAMMLDVR